MPTTTLNRKAKATPDVPAVRKPGLTGGPKRRPAVWGLGVALVAIGAAVAASAALSAGAKHDVLALNRPVPAGRTITAADLRAVRVAADPSIPTVPASEQQSVVGDIAAVDLVANSLLSPGSLGGATSPTAKQALLGVAFKAGQLPARTLNRGDSAELVVAAVTPTGTSSTTAAPDPIPVTVDAEGTVGGDGTTVVDLVMAADVAPKVAAQAAAGQLVLVLLPRARS